MRKATFGCSCIAGALLAVLGVAFTIMSLSASGIYGDVRSIALNAPWIGPLSLAAGMLGMLGGIVDRRHREFGGTLISLCLGCTLFSLGSVITNSYGLEGREYIIALYSVICIALTFALAFTLTVQLAALLIGGLTGAFLFGLGVAITIHSVATSNTSERWVGLLFIVTGALAVIGAIAGRRHRRLGIALMVLCIVGILPFLVFLVLIGGTFLGILIFALIVALIFTMWQRPPANA